MNPNPPSPYIFSRGSLKMTYELVRKKNPTLGLGLLNIMGGNPLPKNAEAINSKHTDQFRVTLAPLQVRAVVEILTMQNLAGVEAKNPGVVSMSKALIEDWLALADQMIRELPADQRP